MQSDFAGKNGFVWFTGIVENRINDPLKMGRIQVRIFGWHDENRTVCPTEDLPWAQLLLPVNANKSFSLPREGEWVFGFFLDGEAGQMPVVSGVYPGLVSNATMEILNTETTGTGSTKSFKGSEESGSTPTNAFDSLPKPSIVPKLPTPPSAKLVEEQLGLPTIVKITREVVDNTAIAFTNNVRSFFCSSDGEVAKSMAFIKSQIRIAAIAIREGFKALLKALGFSASAGGMLETIKSITKYIRDLNELINSITKWVKLIKEVIQRIKAFIEMIKNLIELLKRMPRQLLDQIKKCLIKAMKALKRSLLDDLKEEIPEEIEDLLEAVNGTLANARTLITEINAVSNQVNGVPIIRDPGSEFFSLSTLLASSKESSMTILTRSQTVLQEPNTALAALYLFDGSGNTDLANVNSEILTLEEMEPREREQLVYSIFPGSERFSFSSVKLA